MVISKSIKASQTSASGYENLLVRVLLSCHFKILEGKFVKGSSSETKHIALFLKTAKKKKSFNRDVSSYIDNLLFKYKSRGVLSRLGNEIREEYFKYEYSKLKNITFHESEYVRFTKSMEFLKSIGWHVNLNEKHDPTHQGPYESNVDKEIITFVFEGESFEDGHLIGMQNIYIKGDSTQVTDALYDNGLLSELVNRNKDGNITYTSLRIHPNNDIDNKHCYISIPTTYSNQ